MYMGYSYVQGYRVGVFLSLSLLSWFGQHALVSAILVDMGVVPPFCRQMKGVAGQYNRQKTMTNECMN